MRISPEGKGVFSELFIELAGFLLLSIPGYVMAHDWVRLTITIVLCILTTRFAITLRKTRTVRKKRYDKSQ
jgi:hypothetical protein